MPVGPTAPQASAPLPQAKPKRPQPIPCAAVPSGPTDLLDDIARIEVTAKHDNNLSLLIGGLGLLLMVIAIPIRIEDILWLGVAVFCVGAGFFAKSRGRHPAWGVLGLIGTLPGVLVIYVMPNLNARRIKDLRQQLSDSLTVQSAARAAPTRPVARKPAIPITRSSTLAESAVPTSAVVGFSCLSVVVALLVMMIADASRLDGISALLLLFGFFAAVMCGALCFAHCQKRNAPKSSASKRETLPLSTQPAEQRAKPSRQAVGSTDDRIAKFTEAIRLDSQDVLAYYNRGVVYENISDWPKAIADFSEAIRLDPNNALTYYNRARAYVSNGEHAKAIADFDEAIRLNPNHAQAFTSLGRIYAEMADYEKAISAFSEAIRLNPTLLNAYNYRAEAHRQKGDHDRAIADYTEVIRLAPKDANAYYNRAVTHEKKGNHAQAIIDFTEVIRLNPQGADAYYERGWAYGNNGERAKAEADFAEAKRFGATNPTNEIVEVQVELRAYYDHEVVASELEKLGFAEESTPLATLFSTGSVRSVSGTIDISKLDALSRLQIVESVKCLTSRDT